MNYQGIEHALRTELAHGVLLDAHFQGWIDQAVRDILKDDAFKHLCASSTVASVASTRTIERPTSAASIIAVWYQNTTVPETQPTRELWRVQTRKELRKMFNEVAEGIPSHFIEVEDQDTGAETIELWPIPDAVYSFIIDYTAFPITLSNPTDTNHLTEEWPYAIVYRAKWYGANAVDDQELAQAALGQWGEQMQRMVRFERQDMYAPIGEVQWSCDARPRSGWRQEG
ncbi:MAG: hypothetical protein V3V82_03800 [Acidimicrobiia bacterium]